MTGLPSRNSFRSVEEWKAALMTLPDSNFFELLRSVFGNIKTPFNKQRLLEDLGNFLSRNEIRKIIAAYIDEQDRQLIAAVALLGEPVTGDLEDFFAGEMAYTELHALIVNLEERLILYRFRDEGILRLALNPVLEPVIAPLISEMRFLFPSLTKERGVPGAVLDARAVSPSACLSGGKAGDRMLAALFVFIFNGEELLKAEGGLRKKALDEGKVFFPWLDLELAVRTLLRLGLFRAEGRGLVPCGERIAEYGELSPVEREEYWAAGVYLCMNETADNTGEDTSVAHNITSPEDPGKDLNQSEPAPSEARNDGTRPEEPRFTEPRFAEPMVRGPGGGFWFSRNRLRSIASFIHRFRLLLEPENQYPKITLRRLEKLLGREDAGKGYFLGSDGRVQLPFEPFLAMMEKTGLLERAGFLGKKETYWRAAGTFAPGTVLAEPVIAMDTAFSFILYPEISFADALALGTFCSLKENSGTTVCFELTRMSAIRGFDQGINSAAMVKLLNRLSLNRIDNSLGWTLGDWENRYAGVSLHQGIVLTLAEDRRYLAEAEPVASRILRTLAPGVYLLSTGDKAEAVKALRKAGVDIVAQPPSEPAPGMESRTGWIGSVRNSFPRLGLSVSSAGVKSSPVDILSSELPGNSRRGNAGKRGIEEARFPSGKTEAGSSDSIKQKFRLVLETMRLTKQERDELTARIERRLVLSEAQLEGTSLRYEKLEARGLDYAGKSMIAKQAIASGSMVEASWPGPGGELNRLMGFPSALEKRGGESILILIPEDSACPETIRIPLAKISLLRRIKKSIFGESTTPP